MVKLHNKSSEDTTNTSGYVSSFNNAYLNMVQQGRDGFSALTVHACSASCSKMVAQFEELQTGVSMATITKKFKDLNRTLASKVKTNEETEGEVINLTSNSPNVN